MTPPPALRISPAVTPAELRAFIAVPRLVYAGQPGWVAPLDKERAELLDPRHASFFSHGEAAYWIAWRGDRAVGRVSAQVDRAGDPTAGLFGCLDAAHDADAVLALLDTAAAWLRARGCTSVTGPYMLSINGESGMLLEGHHEPAMVLMPWHPDYLPPLLLAAGFTEARRLESFTLHLPSFDGDDKFAAFAQPDAGAGAGGGAVPVAASPSATSTSRPWTMRQRSPAPCSTTPGPATGASCRCSRRTRRPWSRASSRCCSANAPRWRNWAENRSPSPSSCPTSPN